MRSSSYWVDMPTKKLIGMLHKYIKRSYRLYLWTKPRSRFYPGWDDYIKNLNDTNDSIDKIRAELSRRGHKA